MLFIEQALGHILFPEIYAFFEREEGQREFVEWKKQREQDKARQN